MYSTRVARHLKAPRPMVYRALLDPVAVVAWRVPDGMVGYVHEFDPREGGRFRVSLSYEAPDAIGKTEGRTDTYHGTFLKLIPDEMVMEVSEFETSDPSLQGTMTMTTTLTDAGDGTDISILHEGIPDGVPPADNEAGTRMALDNLARLIEHH